MNFYESPLFVELLLDGICLLVVAALVLTVWSVAYSLRLRRGQADSDRVPARRIAWGVAALLVLTMGATALLADTTPLSINGRAFTDMFWLRMSDMLINTSGILMVVAVVCVVGGEFFASKASKARAEK